MYTDKDSNLISEAYFHTFIVNYFVDRAEQPESQQINEIFPSKFNEPTQ